MKFTLALSTVAIALAATMVDAAPQGAVPRLQPAKVTPNAGTPIQAGDSFKGKGRKGNQSSAAAADSATTSAAADAQTTDASADATSSSSAAAADATSAAADQAANASAGDLQSSLTLDPSQVQPGLANDGQAVPTAGQIASQTSANNFINYCATRPDLPLTNGQQVLTGSCNPTIMGEIVAKDKMPSAKIISPQNLATVKAGETITFQIKVRNMQTGNFVNAQQNYFAAPQQTNSDGVLIAHSHITVNQISSFTDTEAQDPQSFAFFKGLNEPAVNDILSADATGGLDPGFYRACTINSAANHQPALVAVAQHASLDDCTYFQVTADGQPDAGSAAGSDNTGADAGASSSADATSTSTDAADATSTDAAADTSTDAAAATETAAATQGKKGKGQGRKGNNRRTMFTPVGRRRL